MKTLLKYRGGKTRELSHILPHIPKFKGRYIEPFFGGGAVYFALEPKHAIINDINAKLMSFYRAVGRNYDALRQELDEIEEIYTENRSDYERRKVQMPEERIADANEDFYYLLRDSFNGLAECKYSDAAVYFFINKTAYSGMIRYNSRMEFNVPYGRYPNLNTRLVTTAHSQLLHTADIFAGDYSEIFKMARQDDFMFLDPPYDCIFSDYGNEEYREGFNSDHHEQLAQKVMELPCRWLMVIGRTPLTEKLYKDYIVDEYGKSYSVNIRNRFKSKAQHILVANYDMKSINLFNYLES